MAEDLSGGNTGVALLANSIATGAILYVLITGFGPVSGAHFNPAVTLGFLIRKEISAQNAAVFIFVQVLAGCAGVIAANLMFDLAAINISQTVRTGSHQWLAEVIATFGLVTTILICRQARPESVAAAVGLYITAAYWFTSSTSFANPAVTIARTLSDTFAGIAPGDAPMFILAQIIGAVLAVIVFSNGLTSPE